MLLKYAGKEGATGEEGATTQWQTISKRIGAKKSDCLARYNYLIRGQRKKWSNAEDEKLNALVNKHGPE